MAQSLAFALTSGTSLLLPEPDMECFATALAGLPPSAAAALDAIAEDAQVWEEYEGQDALPLAQAYLGCGDGDTLRRFIAIDVGVLDESECVVELWRDKLTADVVATSLAHGDGLDDLPPALAQQLAADVASCWSDREWWIEEIALDLTGNTELPAEQAQCAATAYVDMLGIERAIDRRVLTIPLIAVPPDEQQRLDLAGRCGIEFEWPDARIGAVAGDCLSGFGGGSLGTNVVPCEGLHNGEVMNVHDLNADFSEWPGKQPVRERVRGLCRSDAAALGVDITPYGVGWDYPPRALWERGERAVTCVLTRERYVDWEGPSGLIPTATAPDAPSAPPASTATPAGDEIVDVNTLGVDQCFDASNFSDPTAEDYGILTAADCAAPHDAEVFHVFAITGDTEASYPGDDAVFAEADDACTEAFAPYVGLNYLDSRLEYDYFWPDEILWRKYDDRTVICFLYDPDFVELPTPMRGTAE